MPNKIIADDGTTIPVVVGAYVINGVAVPNSAPFGTPPPLPAGTDRSGTATTTSGALSVAANAARKGLKGENISAVNIGINEFGGTAAIGTAGTYTVTPGGTFSVSTANLINFVAASGTAAVTMTEY